MTLGVAADEEAATVAVAVWPLPGSALPGALLAAHAATLTVTSKPILTSMPLLLMILRILLASSRALSQTVDTDHGQFPLRLPGLRRSLG